MVEINRQHGSGRRVERGWSGDTLSHAASLETVVQLALMLWLSVSIADDLGAGSTAPLMALKTSPPVLLAEDQTRAAARSAPLAASTVWLSLELMTRLVLYWPCGQAGGVVG